MLGQLYSPTGKALETAQQVLEIDNPLACNMAYGCINKCDYCYIPYIKKGEIRFPKQSPLELVKKQLENGLKPEGVFLCFFTDPFIKPNLNVTKELVDFLISKKIPMATLSKVDALLSDYKYMRIGMTIVSDDEFSKKFEPNATLPSKRIQILKMAHDYGFYTWVSIEPYPTPNKFEQSLVKLLSKINFVDFMIFGKWNYDKTTNDKEFYKKMVIIFKRYCEETGIRYFIKKDTLNFIGDINA